MAPTKMQEPAKLSGKELYGRFVVLESIVVALGAAALPKDVEDRRVFLDELKKDAAARAHATGHIEVKAEVGSYTEQLFAAIVAAAET